jgi:uncharacterized membrane protein
MGPMALPIPVPWRTGILTDGDKARIVEAIRAAEARTSGEIRVHVEPRVQPRGADPLERARRLFETLGMTATRDRTGVLVYVAWKDHRLAVLGDEGIHAVVGTEYWRGLADGLSASFRDSRYADGIVAAVEEVGRRLAEHFPRRADDHDELPNVVTESAPAIS